MARDIQGRLGRLKDRRKGLDGYTILSMDAASEVLSKRDITETYQDRSQQPNTQYTLGAMQEVGPSYTQAGIDEANRVGRQLESGLKEHGIYVNFEVQGSVPMNIHIRGVSDVDLLTLHAGFVTYEPNGLMDLMGQYKNPVYYSAADKLKELRTRSESVLRSAFPRAKVDDAGTKAVKISGASLRRAIDVVPSHWHDTVEWQRSKEQHDRGVDIYNKGSHTTFRNYPFKHIKIVTDKDNATLYGLKKCIRLCKNVKSDAEKEGKSVAISSYEIAGLMWHCAHQELSVPEVYELKLLNVTQRHLNFLASNASYAMGLRTPDNTRCIIESAERYNGLVALAAEIDDLAAEVAKEQQQALRYYAPTRQQIQEALERAYIPMPVQPYLRGY